MNCAESRIVRSLLLVALCAAVSVPASGMTFETSFRLCVGVPCHYFTSFWGAAKTCEWLGEFVFRASEYSRVPLPGGSLRRGHGFRGLRGPQGKRGTFPTVVAEKRKSTGVSRGRPHLSPV